MSSFQLAQLNIARLVAPLDSPQLADFVRQLDAVNALADGAPGFVWRLQTEAGDATSLRPFDDERIVVNMSVWQDVESLHAFAFGSQHGEVMRRRREWFERLGDAYAVLWWVPSDHRPSIAEARARLEHLRTHGPTPHAFSFRQPFPASDAAPPMSIPTGSGTARR